MKSSPIKKFFSKPLVQLCSFSETRLQIFIFISMQLFVMKIDGGSQSSASIRGLGERVTCGFAFLRPLDACLDVVDAFVLFALR